MLGLRLGRRLYSTVQIKAKDRLLQFHSIWLRDHCRCPQCLHPTTLQRLHDTSSIPSSIHPAELQQDGSEVKIKWNNDGHESVYQLDWLANHAYDQGKRIQKGTTERVLWDSSVTENPPKVQFRDVMETEKGLRDWIRNINTHGFSLVEGVPATTIDTQRLAERLTFIRVTHFGGFWDFQPDLAHADTAYTNLALGAHTDNTYFSDPSGLQMFHIIEFRGKGGKNVFVDGFRVAEELRKKNPEQFEVLANTPIPTHYIDEKEGVHLKPLINQPIIVTSKDDSSGHTKGSLIQIRFNNDDRAPLVNVAFSEVPRFYEALRSFTQILRSKEMEFHYQLNPGTVIIIDNFRVLHGRSSFSGHRRMVGCYLNHDDFRSRSRVVLSDVQK